MLRSTLGLAVLLAALASAPAQSQSVQLAPDVSLTINGTVQPRVSYAYQEGVGTERLGSGLRRARLQTRATYADRLGFEFDFDGASGDLSSVDLYAFYSITENLQLRAGRQPGAQPKSYTLTSHTLIDAVDRPAISELWAQGTIGSSGRDFGVDLEYETDRGSAVLFVHSGTGSFSRAAGNLRESISASDVTRGGGETGLAVTVMGDVRPATVPGLEVGAFAGVNPVGSESTVRNGVEREYATGGVHVYWGARPGSQPVRVKLDALGVRYEEVAGFQQELLGASLFGAVRVLSHGEAFVRGERFWADVDGEAENYVAVGASYSLSAARGHEYRRARITAAYHYRSSDLRDNAHMAVIQGQFAF